MEIGQCRIQLVGVTISIAYATKIAVNILSPNNSTIYSWKSDEKSTEHKIDAKLPILYDSFMLGKNSLVEAFLTEIDVSSFFGITDASSEYQIQLIVNKTKSKIGKDTSSFILKQADFVIRHSNSQALPIEISGPGTVSLKVEYSITCPTTMEYQILDVKSRSLALQELQELSTTNRIETYFSHQPLIAELFNLLKKYIRKPKSIKPDGEMIESIWTSIISNPKLFNQTIKHIPDLSSQLWSILMKDCCRHHGQYHIAFLILKAFSGKPGGEKYLATYISSFCEICTNYCQTTATKTSDPVSSATTESYDSFIHLLPYLASIISYYDQLFIPRIIQQTNLLKNLQLALVFAHQFEMGNEFCSPLFGLVRYVGKSYTSELDKNGIFEPINIMAMDSSSSLRKVEAFSTLVQFGKGNATVLVMPDNPNTGDLNTQLRHLQATKKMMESKKLERTELLDLAASVAPFLSSELDSVVSICSDILKSIDLTLEEGISLELGNRYCQVLELRGSSPIALDYFLCQITCWLESCLVNSNRPKRVSTRSHFRLNRMNQDTNSGTVAIEGPQNDSITDEDVYFKQIGLPSIFVNHFLASRLFQCLSVAVESKFRQTPFQFHIALWLALCRSNPCLLAPQSEYLSFVSSLSEKISTYPLPMPQSHRQVMEDIFLSFTVTQLEILAKDPSSDSSRSSAVRLSKVLASQWLFSLSSDSYRRLDKGADPSNTQEFGYPSERISSFIKHCWPSYACELINYIADLAQVELEHIDTIIELLMLNVVHKTLNKAGRVELLVLLSQHVYSLVKRYRAPISSIMRHREPVAPEHDQFQILKSCLLVLDLDPKTYAECLSEDEAIQVICWLSHTFEASFWTDPSSSTVSTFDASLMSILDIQDILTHLASLHEALELLGTNLTDITCITSFRPWYKQPGLVKYMVEWEVEDPALVKLKARMVAFLGNFMNKFGSDSESLETEISTDDKILRSLLESPSLRFIILEATLKQLIGSSACPSPAQIKGFVHALHRGWCGQEGDFRSELEGRQFGGRLSFLICLTHLTLFLAAYNETSPSMGQQTHAFRLERTITRSFGNSFIVQSLRLLNFPEIPASSEWLDARWAAIYTRDVAETENWLFGYENLVPIDPRPNSRLLDEFVEFDWQERMELLKKALEVLGSIWENIPLHTLLPYANNSNLDILIQSPNGVNARDRLAAIEATHLIYALRPFCLASIYPCPSVNKFALSWLMNTAWKRLFSATGQCFLQPITHMRVWGCPQMSMPTGGEWLHDLHANMFIAHFNDPIAISQLVSALQSFMIGDVLETSKSALRIRKSITPLLLHYCRHLRELLTDPMKWEFDNILRPTDPDLPTNQHSEQNPNEKEIPSNESYLKSYLETGNWTDLDELAWFTFRERHLPGTRGTPTQFSVHMAEQIHHFSMKTPKTQRPFIFNTEPNILQRFRPVSISDDGDEMNKMEENRREGIKDRAKIYIASFCEAIASMSDFVSKIALVDALYIPRLFSTDFDEKKNPTKLCSAHLELTTGGDALYFACFAAVMLSEFYAGDSIASFRNSAFFSDNSSPDKERAESSPKFDVDLLESDTLTQTTWKVFGSLMKMPDAFGLGIKVPIGLATLELLKIEASKENSALVPSHPLWLTSILPVISSVAPFLGISIYEPYTSSTSEASPNSGTHSSEPPFQTKKKSSKKSKSKLELKGMGSKNGSVASLLADFFHQLVSVVNKDLDELIFILQKVSERRQNGALDQGGSPTIPPSAMDPSLSISLEEEAQDRPSSAYARMAKWNLRMNNLGYYLQMMINLLSFDIPIDKNELLYGPIQQEHIGEPPRSGVRTGGLDGPFLQKLVSSVHLLSLNESKTSHREIATVKECRVAFGLQSLLIHVFSTPEDAVKALSHHFWNQWVGGGEFTNQISFGLNDLPFCVAKLMALSGHLEGDTKFPFYRLNLSRNIGAHVLRRNYPISLHASFSLLPIVSLATHHQQSLKEWMIPLSQSMFQDHVLICFLCDIWNDVPGVPPRLFKKDMIVGSWNMQASLEHRWFADANATKAGNRFRPSYSDKPAKNRYSSALYESETLKAAKKAPSNATSSNSGDLTTSAQSSDGITLDPNEVYYPTVYLGVPNPASANDTDWKHYARSIPGPIWNAPFSIHALHAQRVSMGVAKPEDLVPGVLESVKSFCKKLDFNMKDYLPPFHLPSEVSDDISKENIKSNGLVITMACPELDTVDHFVIPTNRVVNVWWSPMNIGKVSNSSRIVFSFQLDRLLSIQSPSILATFRIGWATASGLKRLNEQPFCLVGDVKGTFGFSFIECGCFNEGKYIPLTKTKNLASINVSRIPESRPPNPSLKLEYHPNSRSMHAHYVVFTDGFTTTSLPMLLSLILPESIKNEDLFPVCSFTSPYTFQLAYRSDLGDQS